MPVVTALRAHGRGCVEVDLDGRAWRVVPLEAVASAALRVGRELDRSSARTLGREIRRVTAREAGLRALRRRDLSEQQLADRLGRAGVAPGDRRAATAALMRVGLVDDTRLAASRAAELARRGYGDAAVRDDLERRGISADEIEGALATLSPEVERAAAEVSRRGESQATARFLLRRGFDPDVVEGAVGAGIAGPEEGR